MSPPPPLHQARHIAKTFMSMFGRPALARQWLLKRRASAPFWLKADYDAVERPDLAYGVLQAARQARALRVPRISVYQFGLRPIDPSGSDANEAVGASLRALERASERVEAETGVRIDVFGFDTLNPAPVSKDPRDVEFARRVVDQRLDVAALEKSLGRAKLIVGDPRETVPRFLYRNYIAPIGFVSLDMRAYTRAAAALRLLDATHDFLLPRVCVRLGQMLGDDLTPFCEHVGERAAAEEFSRTHDRRKIGQEQGLARRRIIPASWNETIFFAHVLDHPAYNTRVHAGGQAASAPRAMPAPQAINVPTPVPAPARSSETTNAGGSSITVTAGHGRPASV